MDINPYHPRTVLAGEPVTAPGWNEIVNAINAITTYLTTTAATALSVTVSNPGAAAPGTRVTAAQDDGTVFQAVAPVPPATAWVFAGLNAGPYTVRVEAAGFEPATRTVTVPSAAPVAFTLTPRGAFMPALFGSTLQSALQDLQNRSIAVSRVLDVTGRDVAPANPGTEFNASLVLGQIPAAGQPVAPDGNAQLVIATSLQVQPTIQVPTLTGLTLAEAQKALESIGLVLGQVTTKQQTPS